MMQQKKTYKPGTQPWRRVSEPNWRFEDARAKLEIFKLLHNNFFLLSSSLSHNKHQQRCCELYNKKTTICDRRGGRHRFLLVHLPFLAPHRRLYRIPPFLLFLLSLLLLRP